MATSSMPVSPLRPAAAPQLHVAPDICPVCEQPIPHDHAERAARNLEGIERDREAAVAARLQEGFEQEKAQVLEQAQQEAAERIEAARTAAQAQAREQLAAVEREKEEAKVALQRKAEEAEADKRNAEAARTALQGQLDQARRDGEAAVQRVRAEAEASEERIRADAARVANEAAEARIAEADAAKAAACEAEAAAAAKLEEAQREKEAEIERLKQDAAMRETTIRAEAQAAANAAADEKVASAEEARLAAETRAAAAQSQVATLQAAHETQLNQRLQEQREALEAAATQAVNVEKAAAFAENLKLTNKVEELKRALEKKTATELGEGAEIDLFEALKGEFKSDRIERVNRGQPGADILHVVVHNGRECGRIIYDSKNHGAWRNDFVTKLASDQMAAKAEHAILSTSKFPAGANQLHIQDGVVIASPARVVALVQLVRQHMVQTYSLRLSNEERAQKTAALYSFITSERCRDLLTRIDTHAEDLLDLQVKEKKAHDATWKKQGELIRSVQRVQAELCTEIDSIIGTGEAGEMTQ